MHIREDLFDKAIDAFHEAAAIPELWPGALAAISEAAGCMASTLLPLRAGELQLVSSPSIRGFLDDFEAGGWLTINPYMRRGLQLTRGGWHGLITSEDMLTAEEKRHDVYVNEVEIPAGIGPKAGIFLISRQPERALPITIERPLGTDPFSRAELRKLNLLMASIDGAARLAMKVGFGVAQRFADSLGGIGRYVGLVDGAGRLLHMPPSFERYLGDAFQVARGRIGARDRDADRRLQAAIFQAITAGPAEARQAAPVLLPRANGARLVVHVVPIVRAAQDVFMLARAAIILTDPSERPGEDLAVLRARYGLSAAEIRLAARIGRGESLAAIAEAEGIVLETARSRLKMVFAKTGTHRQAELAALVVHAAHGVLADSGDGRGDDSGR
jgi:DNA-binding CsgD family transcriptional regulator